MLLVIFGAGASYDSVLHFPPPGATGHIGQHEEFRPPLANQLFDDRRQFVRIMQDYAAVKPLINLLRGNVQVEKQLAKFEEEAKDFPVRHKQLASIRYYLHQMLWNCQQFWREQHRGITNYLTFMDALDRWRYNTHEQLCFVTFNYDTMLEECLLELWGVLFTDLSLYTRDARFKLIKLHGSIDWGLEFSEAPNSGDPRSVLERWKDIRISDSYQKVANPPMNFGNGTSGFPALAIPVEKKSEFMCPPEHLSALANVLPQVTKVITIGWRATEQDFLKMLKNDLTGLKSGVDLMVVSGDLRGATETNTNLGLANPSSGHKYDTVETGFSGLIRDISRLERFLR